MQDMIWTTKTGKLYLVSQMETSHINNCLRIMDRKPNWRKEYRERLELELEIRAMGKKDA